MSKFTDLDLEHKAQLLLNFRIQSLLIQYVAQSEGMEIGEVIAVFTNKATEALQLSSFEVNSHIEEIEQKFEGCIKAESTGAFKINLN